MKQDGIRRSPPVKNRSFRHYDRLGAAPEINPTNGDYFRDSQWIARTPAPTPPPRHTCRILIVHGSPVIRFGLVTLVRSTPHLDVCGEEESVAGACDLFIRERPDVVLLGLALAHGDGLELIKALRKQNPAAETVVLGEREDRLSLERAFRAGARGYVLSCDDTAEILSALEHVRSGEFYASTTATQQLLGSVVCRGPGQNTAGHLRNLTDREMQIFRLIGAGCGPKNIAAELHVSVKTVEAHREHIKQKLGLSSGAQLNARAARWIVDSARHSRSELLAAIRHSRAAMKAPAVAAVPVHNCSAALRTPHAGVASTLGRATAAQRGEINHHHEALILATSDGAIHSATAHARDLLHEFFGGLHHSHQLPRPLSEWLATPHGRRGQCLPFTRDGERAQLVVTLLHPEADRAFCLLLETRPLGAREVRLRTLGLTSRQTEVSRWIAQGKSNSEIALILGVSTHTVNNHVSQILEKLSVDNRTAAAAFATGVL